VNTESKKSELISALLDGELMHAESQQLISQLANAPADKADWDAYHQIGDVLRSDDLAVSFSPDFGSRLSALLDQEPVVLAPRSASAVEFIHADVAVANGVSRPSAASVRGARLWGMGGLIAAGLLVFAIAPRLNIDNNDGAAPAAAGVQMAQSRGQFEVGGAQSDLRNVSNQSILSFDKADAIPMEMLRDPQLDNFLMGHQKGSSPFGDSLRSGIRKEFSQSVSTPYFNSQSPAASSVPTAADR
jgi:sigma-E factor negative regulatory protein RseA